MRSSPVRNSDQADRPGARKTGDTAIASARWKPAVLLVAALALVPMGGLIVLGGVLAGFATAPRAASEEPPTPRERGPHDATSRHPFNEVKKWVRVFDDPARDEWQRPADVVAALHLEPGMTVADLGSGTGYFVEHLSRPVSPGGMVLAIDTEPEMVKYIGARATRGGLGNVVPVLAQPDDPYLPLGRVDRVLIVDTYHHIDNRLGYFGTMLKALTSSGRIAIVDFKKKPLPVGPPPEHKLTRGFVIEEMETAGWTLDREETFLPFQYFLIFRPAGSPAAKAGGR